jgi:hypothetical protein
MRVLVWQRILLMDIAKRTLNMIRAALIFGIAVYMFIGERVAVERASPINAMLFQILAVVAAVNIVVILIVRRSMVMPSLAALQANLAETAALTRWRTGYILTYALCEAVALYGFVLRVLGFSYRMVVPFYLASFILMIYFGPRVPAGQRPSPTAAPVA